MPLPKCKMHSDYHRHACDGCRDALSDAYRALQLGLLKLYEQRNNGRIADHVEDFCREHCGYSLKV
jgi:hypothetical protein